MNFNFTGAIGTVEESKVDYSDDMLKTLIIGPKTVMFIISHMEDNNEIFNIAIALNNDKQEVFQLATIINGTELYLYNTKNKELHKLN